MSSVTLRPGLPVVAVALDLAAGFTHQHDVIVRHDVAPRLGNVADAVDDGVVEQVARSHRRVFQGLREVGVLAHDVLLDVCRLVVFRLDGAMGQRVVLGIELDDRIVVVVARAGPEVRVDAGHVAGQRHRDQLVHGLARGGDLRQVQVRRFLRRSRRSLARRHGGRHRAAHRNAHLERTDALHVSVDALRVRRTQGRSASALRQRAPHRGRCGEAGWRSRSATPSGVPMPNRVLKSFTGSRSGAQRHVRAEVREIQARRAHVYARVLQDARLERLVRLVLVNGVRNELIDRGLPLRPAGRFGEASVRRLGDVRRGVANRAVAARQHVAPRPSRVL